MTDSNIQHLFSNVPFHELVDKDINSMSPTEAVEFVKKLRSVRVAPSDKKKMKSTAVKTATSTKKHGTNVKATLDDLL